MKPEFSRLFPWQTAEQFISLRGIHYYSKNVFDLPLRWLDFWTMPYELVWQHLEKNQDKISWEANRLLFLQECVVAKWLCNKDKFCLVHLMLDKDDVDCYNRVDIGFYLFSVDLEPSFFVKNENNHQNYPWKSDGQLGLELICTNMHRKCSFSKLHAKIEN